MQLCILTSYKKNILQSSDIFCKTRDAVLNFLDMGRAGLFVVFKMCFGPMRKL